MLSRHCTSNALQSWVTALYCLSSDGWAPALSSSRLCSSAVIAVQCAKPVTKSCMTVHAVASLPRVATQRATTAQQHNCCHTATVLPSRFTHMLGLMTARTTEKRYFFHMETRMKLCAVFLILDYTAEERPRRPCYGLRWFFAPYPHPSLWSLHIPPPYKYDLGPSFPPSSSVVHASQAVQSPISSASNGPLLLQ